MNEIEKLYENAEIAPELLLDAKTKEEVARRFEYGSEDTDFEESLSGLINIIWQSLTDTEKEQIKEILNG